LEEQEDWKRIIDRMTGSKFATRRFKCDPKRRSRRYGIGFFGRKKIKRGALVYAIDTSGSMADHEMAVCVANGKHLAARYGAPFLVLVCDATIQATKLVKKSVDLDQVDMIGGGGTSSLPVFDYLKEHNVQADLLVYFTDLYIDFPPEKPENVTDMVWAVINNESADEVPFGEIVHVEVPEVKG
jgi:predicted metal-dependent peptidase